MTRTLGVLLLLVATALLLAPAPAQDAPGGILYTRAREFRVPFNIGPGAQTLSQLQLYVSTDSGLTWAPVAAAAPDQGYFRFTTPNDGAFWFAVQSFDIMNRPFPQNMRGATPNLKVIVDNQPPTVSVQALAPKANEVGVSWSVRDDHFNANKPDAIRVDYRSLSAGGSWLPLNVPAGVSQLYWTPNAAGAIEVRVQARDRADNVGESFANVALGGGAAPLAQPPAGPNPGYTRNYDNPGAILNPPAPGELRFVSSKKIKLDCDLKDVGPSDVSAVDLWYTQDGRTWKPHGQATFDKNDKSGSLTFHLEREAQYGVTLVAKSGVGLGERAPITGDRPQMWIEVDLTKPVVTMRGPEVGRGDAKGKLKILWNATDKNLGPDCMTLRYAETLAGNWTPIVEKIGHTGEYIWTMPEKVPYQFFIKVEAVDKAGNLGEDVTSQAVKVDLSIPRAIPLKVIPAN